MYVWPCLFGGASFQRRALGPEPLSDWVLLLPYNKYDLRLMGVTEDVRCKCDDDKHLEIKQQPHCRRLCDDCEVPICKRCQVSLQAYTTVGSVPTAIANDNYYGYVCKLLTEKSVTWLECAAASLCWSTILVYYLEEPYGHLMLESMEGAQARIQVRGNLFSFSMPWEDIENACLEALRASGCPGVSESPLTPEEGRRRVALPHNEDLLATLLNIHIVGGSVDLALHIEGATIRPRVVAQLIAQLRRSGYPGYEAEVNEQQHVEERLHRMYTSKYGEGPFMPTKIKEAAAHARRASLRGPSLIADKSSHPAEPAGEVAKLMRTISPLQIVAERSGAAITSMHEDYGSIFSRYQNLSIQTGSKMADQHKPQYLGMAFPFTLPAAVGGYDVAGQKSRWRRPNESEAAEFGDPNLKEWWYSDQSPETAAAEVKLFDITRSLPQRIEGQFRRHWSFVPGLWNLYFREQINLGANLRLGAQARTSEPAIGMDVDAAMAAADLYEKLHRGYYTTPDGKRCKIDGDTSKLSFAVGISDKQKQLLADFRFRTRLLPGTQEIRSTIGRVGFWALVVYGNATFMTVPSWHSLPSFSLHV